MMEVDRTIGIQDPNHFLKAEDASFEVPRAVIGELGALCLQIMSDPW